MRAKTQRGGFFDDRKAIVKLCPAVRECHVSNARFVDADGIDLRASPLGEIGWVAGLNNMPWPSCAYCLGAPGLPLGASLGLQASGLPSGAQHVPFTVPCGDEKLQSWPLLTDLQASSASAGGLRGPPVPSAVCAERPQQAVNAPAQTVTANMRPKGKVKLLLAFMIHSGCFGKHLCCRG